MIYNKNIIFNILFSILSLSICAPSPFIEPMEQILSGIPSKYCEENKFPFSPQKYSDSNSELELSNSIATITFFDEHKIIEHELTLTAKNLPEDQYYYKWSFTTSSEGLTVENNYCKIYVKGEPSTRECKATNTPDIENKRMNLSYSMKLYNNEQMIINYRFKKTKSKEILYKKESVVIPLISESVYCDYKFIIPDGYISLGLQENLLTKQSNTLYTYKGNCHTGSQNKNDVIRYSPETVLWKADTGVYLEYPSRFTNNVTLIFPRYYRGGKLKNTLYKLNSTLGNTFKEENQINKDQKLEFELPAINYDKVGAELHTGFSNKLTDDFNVYLPESYYDINITQIDDEIKSKVKEIISEASDKPNYYKIGKFVNSYLTYTSSYTGKKLTVNEIYHSRKGVCEHYTLLYNAMLNIIGIKTLYVSGWAFDKDETSGDKNTVTHAWSAALINGKWKELDSTWGLFEGVPAGHVLKNFGYDTYSYYWYEVKKPDTKFYKTPFIEVVTKPVIDDNSGYQKPCLMLLMLFILAL